MKTLLRIDCSARITGSHSRALADYFETEWRNTNPNGQVIYRDLTKTDLPHIQNQTIEGFYTPPSAMSSAIKAATALSDTLIEELKTVDIVLISSPLYNLNIPSNLKAYLDQVVRVGHTFGINENGYFGLLNNLKAFIITAKGGVYKGTHMEKYDFQTPYLNAILGHMGIQINATYTLEGTSTPQLAEYQLAIEHDIKQTLKN